MTLSISTPAGLAAAIASPVRIRRPPRLVRNTLSLVSRFCEFDVPQPFPYSDLASMPDPEQGIFIHSSLTPIGEALLREGLELAVRLAIDARHAEVLPCSLPTDSVQLLLNLAIENSLEAQGLNATLCASWEVTASLRPGSSAMATRTGKAFRRDASAQTRRSC